jgi:hypothetical protein
LKKQLGTGALLVYLKRVLLYRSVRSYEVELPKRLPYPLQLFHAATHTHWAGVGARVGPGMGIGVDVGEVVALGALVGVPVGVAVLVGVAVGVLVACGVGVSVNEGSLSIWPTAGIIPATRKAPSPKRPASSAMNRTKTDTFSATFSIKNPRRALGANQVSVG